MQSVCNSLILKMFWQNPAIFCNLAKASKGLCQSVAHRRVCRTSQGCLTGLRWRKWFILHNLLCIYPWFRFSCVHDYPGTLMEHYQVPLSCLVVVWKVLWKHKYSRPYFCFFMRCFVAFITLGHRMGIGESLSCGFQVAIKRSQVGKSNSSCLGFFVVIFFGFGNKSKLKNIFQVL